MKIPRLVLSPKRILLMVSAIGRQSGTKLASSRMSLWAKMRKQRKRAQIALKVTQVGKKELRKTKEVKSRKSLQSPRHLPRLYSRGKIQALSCRIRAKRRRSALWCSETIHQSILMRNLTTWSEATCLNPLLKSTIRPPLRSTWESPCRERWLQRFKLTMANLWWSWLLWLAIQSCLLMVSQNKLRWR